MLHWQGWVVADVDRRGDWFALDKAVQVCCKGELFDAALFNHNFGRKQLKICELAFIPKTCDAVHDAQLEFYWIHFVVRNPKHIGFSATTLFNRGFARKRGKVLPTGTSTETMC